MEYKKFVKGERVVAVILDFIFYQIAITISSLFAVPFFGWQAFMEFTWNGEVGGIGEFTEELIGYMILSAIISLILGIFYYVYVPYKKDGKTLGKVILRIKVVDDIGQNPPFKVHFIRSIAMWGTYLLTPITFVILFNPFAYTVLSGVIGFAMFMLTLIAFLMILFRQDERGLHDLIANTYVVDDRYDPDLKAVEAATQAKDWAQLEDGEDDDFMKDYDKDDPWSK